jgi:U3 small nucleolar ribonucleoprotein protein IMP3
MNKILISFFKIFLFDRHTIGLIPTKENLELVDKITASRFCRRRLPVIMTRNRMAQHLPGAVKFIEQGHIRIGPDIVNDPAFLVTR